MYLAPALIWKVRGSVLPQRLYQKVSPVCPAGLGLTGTGNFVWLMQAVLRASVSVQDPGRKSSSFGATDSDGKLIPSDGCWAASMGENNRE